MSLTEFNPGWGLSSPHIQTILSSVGRKVARRGLKRSAHADAFDALESRSERSTVAIDDKALQVAITLNEAANAPLIVVVPGWLGNDHSSYVVSASAKLHAAGYHVARLTLRDHPGTEHLNESMFNSAMIDEVVALVAHLGAQHGSHGVGLIGYSLGGNFALRAKRALPTIPTLAICPALDPAETMYRIDQSFIYQRYFVNKWRRTWLAKQAAFASYDFSAALRLSTVSALTDYFVRRYTEFASSHDYFDAYTLTGDALRGLDARILIAEDDPIIPAAQYVRLPSSLELERTTQGGHGAYLKDWTLSSWADDYAVHFFDSAFTTSG